METENDKIGYLLNFDSGDFAANFSKVLNGKDNHEERLVQASTLLQMCTMSREGHQKVMAIMDQIKDTKKERYRFEWIVKDLGSSGNNWTEYKTCLLRLINAIVDKSEQLLDRRLIRCEFTGLKAAEVFKQLRCERSAGKQAELINEIERFELKRHNEEDAEIDVDINNSSNIFHAVCQQIKDTPREAHFLFCLQNFLQLESDQAWEYSSRFIGKVAMLEDAKQLNKLLKDESKVFECRKHLDSVGMLQCQQSDCACPCHSLPGESMNFKQKVLQAQKELESTTPLFIPAPPPPPPLMLPPPPPPPPPFLAAVSNSGESRSPGSGRKLPQIPADDSSHNPVGESPPTSTGDQVPCPPLPLNSLNTSAKTISSLPMPKKRLRRLLWNKIPSNAVLGKRNIWTTTATAATPDLSREQFSSLQKLLPVVPPTVTKEINFELIEDLFALSESPPNSNGAGNGTDERDGKSELKRKKIEEVSLLDSKRSLNVNIFLHQIRLSHKDLVERIARGNTDFLTIEKLKGLMRILPEKNEVELVQSYEGDQNKLGNAERFFMVLNSYPQFASCVEALLMKEEFEQLVDTLKPVLETYTLSIQDIKDSKLLQEVFQILLITGNFLNSGVYGGDAVAFKLSSLTNLTELKSNEPGMTLMHYIATIALEKNRKLLQLPEELKWLKEASQYSFDSLIADATSLRKKAETIANHVPNVGEEISKKLSTFLEFAEKELEDIEEKKNELEVLRCRLAEYFCEDEKSFKLDESIQIISSFVDKFEKAIAENNKKTERNRVRTAQVKFRRQSSLSRETDTLNRSTKCKSEILQVKIDSQTCPDFEKLQTQFSNVDKEQQQQQQQRNTIATPPVKDGERKVRQMNDDGSGELLNFLNYSSSASPDPDASLRLRRKSKTPVTLLSFEEGRERPMPDLDTSRQFDRNSLGRRSLMDCRPVEIRKYFNGFDKIQTGSDHGLSNKETEKPLSCFASFSRTAARNSDFEATAMTDQTHLSSQKKEAKPPIPPGGKFSAIERDHSSPSLTQKALLKHIQENAAINAKASLDSKILNESGGFNDRKDLQSDYDTEIKYRKKKQSQSHQIPASNSIDEKIRHYGDPIGQAEIDSISSGTDEGFESMRSSVIDDGTIRTSPYFTSQRAAEESEFNSKKTTQHQLSSKSHSGTSGTAALENSTPARSFDSLVNGNVLSLPQNYDDSSSLRGSSSALFTGKNLSIDDGAGGAMQNKRSGNCMDLREVNTPKESSTSTLKSSSGSGLHIKAVEEQLETQGTTMTEERVKLRHSSHGKHDEIVTRQRGSSLSDGSTASDGKKNRQSVNIDQLTARLSQPKRLVHSVHTISSANQTAALNPQPQHKTPKHVTTKTSTNTALPPSDLFVRGSLFRTTLPANGLSFNKKRASAQFQINPTNDLNATTIAEYAFKNLTAQNASSLDDAPPSPPVRTTSMTAAECLAAGIPCASNNRGATKSPQVRTNPSSHPSNITIPYDPVGLPETAKKEPTGKNAGKTGKSSPSSKTSLFHKLTKSNKNQNITANEEPSAQKLSRPTKPGSNTLTRYKR